MVIFCFVLFLIVFIFYLFFGEIGSSLLYVGLSDCSEWASRCGGFCYCEAWALGPQASVSEARGL